jgi:hypothetical protein
LPLKHGMAHSFSKCGENPPKCVIKAKFAVRKQGLQQANYAGRSVPYNCGVPKRQCIERAKWRLVPGRPAAPLSEHYKLDCDYGTPIMALYKTGDGSDAVYLCGNHIGEVQVRAGHQNFGDVRVIESEATAAVNGESAARAAVSVAEIVAPKPMTPIAPGPARSVKSLKAATSIDRPPVRKFTRDLTYGNAAKALVDEAIWNMAAGDFELYKTALRQGRAPIEAALAAGGQLAIVHRKISEYTIKLEAALFESKARISREEAVDKPFEQATQEIIASDALDDAAKDTAMEHIGALQESINKGLESEISPLQAHRIACAIGERVNWGTSASLGEELRPAYRAVYGSVRSALRRSAPHVQMLEERLVNLFAARADLDHSIASKDSQRLTA